MRHIKPTKWSNPSNKTDAIDFSKPFLWFDDDIFPEEIEALSKHDVLENWIEVDLQIDPNQLQKIIQSFPIPINALEE